MAEKYFQLSSIKLIVLGYTLGLGIIFTLLTSLSLTLVINVLIYLKVLHLNSGQNLSTDWTQNKCTDYIVTDCMILFSVT